MINVTKCYCPGKYNTEDTCLCPRLAILPGIGRFVYPVAKKPTTYTRISHQLPPEAPKSALPVVKLLWDFGMNQLSPKPLKCPKFGKHDKFRRVDDGLLPIFCTRVYKIVKHRLDHERGLKKRISNPTTPEKWKPVIKKEKTRYDHRPLHELKAEAHKRFCKGENLDYIAHCVGHSRDDVLKWLDECPF